MLLKDLQTAQSTLKHVLEALTARCAVFQRGCAQITRTLWQCLLTFIPVFKTIANTIGHNSGLDGVQCIQGQKHL